MSVSKRGMSSDFLFRPYCPYDVLLRGSTISHDRDDGQDGDESLGVGSRVEIQPLPARAFFILETMRAAAPLGPDLPTNAGQIDFSLASPAQITERDLGSIRRTLYALDLSSAVVDEQVISYAQSRGSVKMVSGSSCFMISSIRRRSKPSSISGIKHLVHRGALTLCPSSSPPANSEKLL